jgi:hypothetical protein
MKNVINTIKEELTLKIDLVNNEYEIGWFWVIIQLPSLYLLTREITIMLIKNFL